MSQSNVKMLSAISEQGLRANLLHFTKLKESAEEAVKVYENRRQEILSELNARGIE